MVGSDVLLETEAAGTGNWLFRGEGEPVTGAEPIPEIVLDVLRIEDAQITYRDGKSGHETRLAMEQLTVDGQDDGERIDLAAGLRGQRFRLKGSTGRLESLFASAVALPVDPAPATDGATATMNGMLGSHILSRRATIRTAGGRPSLGASVAGSSLDLSQLAQPKGKHPSAGRVGERRLFSDAPLPFPTLPALDVKADVRIERLVLPNRVALKAVQAGLALKNGHLELQPLRFNVAGGAVSGRATLDATQGKAPRLAVSLEGKGISLEELATELGRAKQITGGRTNLAINLSGAGPSLHRLMTGASGEVRVVIGPARLSDSLLDVGGDALTKLIDAVNPFHKSDKGTELTCAVARLPVRAGLITVDRSIAYETSKINVVAAGTINLRDESLVLAIRPAIKQGVGLGAGNLAQLVRVTGTLTDPSINLDTLGVARQMLSLYAALATSGASLLVEKVLKGPVDAHPCQSALAAGTSKPKRPRSRRTSESSRIRGARLST